LYEPVGCTQRDRFSGSLHRIYANEITENMKTRIVLSACTLLIALELVPAIADDTDAVLERLRMLEGRVERIENELDEYERVQDRNPSTLSGKTVSGEPTETKADRKNIIIVELSNKKYIDLKYNTAITWDSVYTDRGLKADARSIKGTLVFADLFRESKFRVRVTIDDPMDQGESVRTEGTGIEYNQFLDDHKWLKSTELDDMTVWFETEQVLYFDGELVSVED